MTKKIEEYEWFCPEPFTNFSVATDGEFRPCCTMPRAQGASELDHYYIDKHTFEDYYNGKFATRLRKAFKNGDDKEFLDKYCHICKDMEKSGVKSHRQWYNDRFNKIFKDKKEELERIVEEESYPTFHHSVEVDGLVGNLCNLQCNMCGPRASSALAAEKMKLNEIIIYPFKKTETGKQTPLIKIEPNDAFMDHLSKSLNNTLELKLVGGEPLLSKNTYRLLEECNNPNVHLRMISNGTIDPTRFIELARKFKSVDINISIEGWGKVNDYIRYPAVWDDIWKYYMQYKTTTNFSVTFVNTINALNVGYLHEFVVRLRDHKYTHGSLVGNNFYSVKSVPPDIRKIYLEKLYRLRKFPEIPKLIGYLETLPFVESDMNEMIRHIRRRDDLRGTNLLELFPEWEPYYNKITDYEIIA